MKTILRLSLLLSLPAFCYGSSAREIIDRIKVETGVQPPANTVDTIKAGDPDTPITGIATTFMDTLDVLKRAAAAGRNLVISHEPTFYSHLDRTESLQDDSVYQEKAKFIRDHHMVVWRFHDMWHARKPDGILEGMVTALAWAKYQSPNDPRTFVFPETTLDRFSGSIRDKLHIRNFRVVGDPAMKLSKVAFLPGASGSLSHLAKLRLNDVDVLVVGEAPEWETIPYVQDAVSEGRRKALIIMGHVASEEQGMAECARWLKSFIKDVPVEFIPAGEPYWSPTHRPLAERMQSLIDERVVPGAVALVATKDAVLRLVAFGYADPAMTTLMPADGIFWIASMTKPVTASAIMMLEDQGKLSVEDPVAKYIPAFSHFDRVVTIRHLLTHTSGLPEVTDEEASRARSLADLVSAITSKPLKFEPGARWSYCQSGINMLGRIIEVASGESYEHYILSHLFTPLKMKDTAFFLSKEQAARWVRPVKREGDRFVETPIGILYGNSPESRERFAAPNAGIFTTASDYARFAQMILNKGAFEGHRLLSEKAVAEMTAVQTSPGMHVGFTPGMAYGFGWGVVERPTGVTDMLSPGTYGHGGAYGTQAWIDPVKNRILVLMVNRAGLEGGDAHAVRYAFQEAATGSQ